VLKTGLGINANFFHNKAGLGSVLLCGLNLVTGRAERRQNNSERGTGNVNGVAADKSKEGAK
jgi:hypothetical protein